MAKSYLLDIMIDDKGVVTHEKVSEGLSPLEMRLIISVLEEYKQQMITYILYNQNITNLKTQKKQ